MSGQQNSGMPYVHWKNLNNPLQSTALRNRLDCVTGEGDGLLPGLFPPMIERLRWIFGFFVVLVVTGCGNNPQPAPLRERHVDGKPWTVRYVSMGDDPRSLDPQRAYDQMSRRILEPTVETLLEYHPFKTAPYEVAPALLAEVPHPESQSDGTIRYTCRLRSGIRFVDDPCFPSGKGRELVAEDVQYAFQRLCDPRVASPVFGNLAEYVAGMNEVFEGAQKNGEKMDYGQRVRGVEVIDAQTFRLHLLKPYPQILYWLAMHFTSPIPREAVDYYDGKAHPDGASGALVQRPKFEWHPVGTGPFVLHSYTPSQSYRLVRNPEYKTTVFPLDGWPAEREQELRPLAGAPLPLVDEVVLTVFREALPSWLMFRQGYLDGVGVSKDAFNSVVTPDKELSQEYRDRGMRLEKDVEPSTFYLSFNLQDPVLGPNRKLRQALSCALDIQGWLDIFHNGVPLVAQQLVPPGLPGHDPKFQNPYGHNLDKGRRLLAEAGYPDGRDSKTGKPLKLTMDVNATGAQERQGAEFVQAGFRKLGIEVEVIENNFARMLEKEDQGNFQMASGTGWGADYPDPENFFFLFYSKNMPPAGKNVSRYQNEEFDRLFEKMATMENTPEREEIVKRMNAILAEDCPVILEFHKAYYVLVPPFAPRTQSNPMLEGGLKYARVDHALREQKRREWNPVPKWPLLALGMVLIGALAYGVSFNRRNHV
jgi:oligopeptide transport system substrate-binding protein